MKKFIPNTKIKNALKSNTGLERDSPIKLHANKIKDYLFQQGYEDIKIKEMYA